MQSRKSPKADLEEEAKMMLLNGESHVLVKWFIRQKGGNVRDFSHLFKLYPEATDSADTAPKE